jgi:hypothetical protein
VLDIWQQQQQQPSRSQNAAEGLLQPLTVIPILPVAVAAGIAHGQLQPDQVAAVAQELLDSYCLHLSASAEDVAKAAAVADTKLVGAAATALGHLVTLLLQQGGCSKELLQQVVTTLSAGATGDSGVSAVRVGCVLGLGVLLGVDVRAGSEGVWWGGGGGPDAAAAAGGGGGGDERSSARGLATGKRDKCLIM